MEIQLNEERNDKEEHEKSKLFVEKGLRVFEEPVVNNRSHSAAKFNV